MKTVTQYFFLAMALLANTNLYASWLVTYNLIDREVYVNEKLGRLMNRKCVPLKMQIDTTITEDVQVKSLYGDTHQVRIDYGITSMRPFSKPVIDSKAYQKWPTVTNEAGISNDGQYAYYAVSGQSVAGVDLVLTSSDGRWKKRVQAVSAFSCSISDDNRWVMVKQSGDSLLLVKLGTSFTKQLKEVKSAMFVRDGQSGWMAWLTTEQSPRLKVGKPGTQKQYVFEKVKDYQFAPGGRTLVFRAVGGTPNTLSLNQLDLLTGKQQKLWEGKSSGDLIFSNDGRQVVFSSGATIWHYQLGMEMDRKAIGIAEIRMPTGFELVDISGFSRDGRRLIISLKATDRKLISPAPDIAAVKLNIWSYTDTRLQPTQLRQTELDAKCYALVDLKSQDVIVLQQENEEGWPDKSMDYLLSRTLINGDRGEYNWNRSASGVYTFVSTRDGSRKVLPMNFTPLFAISPSGRHLVYYDQQKKTFFSYEVVSGSIRNLTSGVTIDWIGPYADDLVNSSPRGIIGWFEREETVLLYDKYDIWQIDVSGKKQPLCLTNGYGRRHHIVFSLAENDVVDGHASLLLNAFNLDTKDNGFYRKTVGKNGDPELLSMGPYIYDIPNGLGVNPYIPSGLCFKPLKSKDAAVYLVKRSSASESPNYFSTRDFKTFTRLSELRPEEGYNWYKTELHSWESLDGRKLQGILYKPENFDPRKKYPVIFYYYERKSDALNAYLPPENLCSGCSINIPSYVSKGYLVFSPDVHYRIGNPMQGSYDALISAARYVSLMPFVDSKKLGIQGCSFGGIQTNYLITKTDLFTAACSASGYANWISEYGGLTDSGSEIQSVFEHGQSRMGAPLWEIPEQYIKNSPIFQLHKVSTPLLAMHTTKDGICLFQNMVELFIGLRRLGKKVWMLEYEDGNHGVSGKSAEDFSIRMMQFFDHYLMDKPAPIWMLDGIQAKHKGLKTGLELDTTGRIPGPGLLTKEAQEKVEALLHRKPIIVTIP